MIFRFMGCVVLVYNDQDGKTQVHLCKGTRRMDIGDANESQIHEENWRTPWSRTLAPLPEEYRL